ncbi:MAG: HTTM domain-containing protein [Cyanobacteria bacterium P01_D01_bin.156]
MKVFQILERRYSQWLTRPAQNAAGRMGLYRIVYSLFYLWFLSHLRFSELSLVPTSYWEPTVVLKPFSPLPGAAYPAMEIGLVMALVLLLLGYKTRISTLMVLILGFGLTMFRTGLLVQDRTLVVTVFYVPLVMLLSNWGVTYSIDSVLQHKQGKPAADPTDSSWHYIWPARALMVIISILFLSAAIAKFQRQDWLVNPRFVQGFLLSKGVASYLSNGFPVNPLGPKLGQIDAFIIPTQYIVLLFEAVFILVLFSRIAQAIIFRLAPIFHSFNTLLLGIPFISVLSIYAAFPDWQSLYQQFYPKQLRINGLTKLSAPGLRLSSVGLAIVIGLLWNTTPIPRQIFGLFELFSYQTLWFALLPFILLWIASSLKQRRSIYISHERL